MNINILCSFIICVWLWYTYIKFIEFRFRVFLYSLLFTSHSVRYHAVNKLNEFFIDRMCFPNHKKSISFTILFYIPFFSLFCSYSLSLLFWIKFYIDYNTCSRCSSICAMPWHFSSYFSSLFSFPFFLTVAQIKRTTYHAIWYQHLKVNKCRIQFFERKILPRSF